MFAEDFMASFREIDMSIHSLLDSQPVEKVETTAEEILEKYKQSEAEEAESKGRLGFVYTEKKANAKPNCFVWSILELNVKAHLHQENAKAKILFVFFKAEGGRKGREQRSVGVLLHWKKANAKANKYAFQ